MKKLAFISFLVIFSLDGAGQGIDTVDYYMFSSLSLSNGIYSFNGTPISKEFHKTVETAHNRYNSIKGIRFVRHLDINSTLKFTTYEEDQEIGPFGKLINYYPNGQIKSIFQFQNANDSLTNFNIPEGAWLYLNEKGDTIGYKQYKDGLAHGKWYGQRDDSSYVIREFKNGFSDGTWSVHRLISGGGEYHRPYTFHDGIYHSIYVCNENFKSILDEKENIYHYQKEWIIVEKIKYAEKRKYIISGKFYVIHDGIIAGLKEFKKGELVQHIKYDY